MILKFNLVRVEREDGVSYGRYRNTNDPKVILNFLLNSEEAFFPDNISIFHTLNFWTISDDRFVQLINKTHENGKASEGSAD